MIVQAVPQPTADFDGFFAERYEHAVRGAYLLTYSSPVAEDIVQDAFGQVLRRWDDIRNPEAYLWRAITNGARSWGRKERRVVPIDRRPDPTNDADALAVREALGALPRAQREVLVMRHYLAMKEREIAEALGCPIGTVKSHAHRGLAAMKEALK